MKYLTQIERDNLSKTTLTFNNIKEYNMKTSWNWIKENKMLVMAAIIIAILAYNAIAG